MYDINLHDKQSKETHWVSLSIDKKTAVYFNSFRTEYIPQDVLGIIRDQSQYKTYLEYSLMTQSCVYFLVLLS